MQQFQTKYAYVNSSQFSLFWRVYPLKIYIQIPECRVQSGRGDDTARYGQRLW